MSRYSKMSPWTAPGQRGLVSIAIPASLGNEFIEVTGTIPQQVPCGGVVCCDPDDDTLALPIFCGGRWNNAPKTIKLRLYMIGPYAGGTVVFHYAIFPHQGPP